LLRLEGRGDLAAQSGFDAAPAVDAGAARGRLHPAWALHSDKTPYHGTPASGSTKSTVASVLRRLFTWAREERIMPTNPALELRTGWGGSIRRRVIIPSIPQVLRLAEALDRFKPSLGDVAMVLAFTGLRWEEAGHR
jgi:integrase